MRKFVLSVLIFFNTFYICGAEDKLRLLIDPENAPWTTIINGKPAGIDVDIVNAVSKKMKIKVDYVIAPWARNLAIMESGEADIMGFLARRSEREVYMVYLEPPYQGDVKMFFLRKGEKDSLKTYTDLYKLKVGVIRGTKHFEPFDSDLKIQKIELNKLEQACLMVVNYRLDTVIGNDTVVPIIIKKLGLQDKLDASDYKVPMGKNGYFAISKKSKFLNKKQAFEKILKEMLNSGEIDRIIDNGLKKYY